MPTLGAFYLGLFVRTLQKNPFDFRRYYVAVSLVIRSVRHPFHIPYVTEWPRLCTSRSNE